tara:strand:+ start:110 stop:652 length:543 start_codon:yes stop_codon:yes gene_type:complete
MEEQKELEEGIKQAIKEVRESKALEKVNSLSRINPQKVGKILHLIATGVSQTQMVRKHKITRSTLVSVLTDYADYLGKFRELGGKLSARSYINLESLEEDMVEALRLKMEGGYIPDFKDLKEISIAKSNSQRQAMTARGEASNITEERKVYTQEDYEDTLKAVRERLKKKQKPADIIDVE